MSGSAPRENVVFVGGISRKVDEACLRNFFSTFGTVTECKIIIDHNTGKSKGYGFVVFADRQAADTVKKAPQEDLFLLGKSMNVGDAFRKAEGTPGGMPGAAPAIGAPAGMAAMPGSPGGGRGRKFSGGAQGGLPVYYDPHMVYPAYGYPHAYYMPSYQYVYPGMEQQPQPDGVLPAARRDSLGPTGAGSAPSTSPGSAAPVAAVPPGAPIGAPAVVSVPVLEPEYDRWHHPAPASRAYQIPMVGVGRQYMRPMPYAYPVQGQVGRREHVPVGRDAPPMEKADASADS